MSDTIRKIRIPPDKWDSQILSILLEESYKVFEEFEAVLSQFVAELATGDDDTPVGVVAHALAVLPEADIDIQTSPVNTDADAIFVPHNTARISVTKSLA